MPPSKSRIARPLNWLRILRTALREKADFYHFHDPELLLIGALLRIGARKSVVYDIHEHYPAAVRERRWIPKFMRAPVSRFLGVIELPLSQLMTAIVVADDGLEERFAVRAREVVKLYNFPLKSLFKETVPERERPLVEKPPTAVYVGGIGPERGILTMLQTTSIVVNELGRDMKLRLVGAISSGLERPVDERINLLNIADSVEFVGRVPHEELPDYMRDAYLGFLALKPSRFAMNIPTKMFEYMACALPIVATDCATTRRFMDGLDFGFLIASEKPEPYAEAIVHLLDHPEEAKRMGQNGRRAFLERYNWDSEAAKLLDLYRRLGSHLRG